MQGCEFRLDGLLVPRSADLAVPVIFIEAQMQPDSRTIATAPAAQALLSTVKPQGEEAFQQMLNLVEAILINKFPQLSTQEILTMLDIKTADFRQTRFYQEVLEEGRQEGLQEGRQEGLQEGRREAEATLLMRFLTRRLGALSEEQVAQIRALPLEQLDALSEVLFNLADLGALEVWLQTYVGDSGEPRADGEA